MDPLFAITKEHLETGLRGFPVGYCTTSVVDPMKGLHYMGQPIAKLAKSKPEEVIYLLCTGSEGNEKQIEVFSKELQKRAPLSEKTVTAIKKLPREGHPMALFSIAIMLTGIFEGKNDYVEDAWNLIAKVPEIAAQVINHRAGWGGCRPSNPKLGYMENFTQMLNVPQADPKKLTEAMRLFNVLHYDHGGGNLSTFVGKATASGLEDMWGSMSAAMNALAGPRHGRANQDCLEFVEQILKELGEKVNAADLEALIRKKLDNKELVFGFGHAVLRVEDARATVFYDIAKEHYASHPLVKTALLLREVVPGILKENPKISDPYPNVDAISGILLTAAGFPYPEYFTVLFGLSRVVGIARQIVFERCEARDGRGLPIVRPKYLFAPREQLTSVHAMKVNNQ